MSQEAAEQNAESAHRREKNKLPWENKLAAVRGAKHTCTYTLSYKTLNLHVPSLELMDHEARKVAAHKKEGTRVRICAGPARPDTLLERARILDY